ncbi:hypothetical protein [Hamadaea tsunoensis]|uniref:hypothetical protein n=1 Tax=Hamadaea tsunoensis TaxID=53368 RepID=UPI00041296C0|nr:hypothetical protein [Hamadaea tsunoensis]
MGQTITLAFLAGVFGANGVPHFVRGITRETYPSAFGYGPVVNLVAGWLMFVLAAVAGYFAHPATHPLPAVAAIAAGVLAMGLFHAGPGAFGRKPPVGAAPEAGEATAPGGPVSAPRPSSR